MLTEEDAKRLEALLSAIPGEDILALLGHRRVRELHQLVTGSTDKEPLESAISSYAVALEGSRILGDPTFLAKLLNTLGSQRLREIAGKHLDTPFARDADNALAIAAKPLREGSALTETVLAALGLSNSVVQEAAKKPGVESVDPFEPLPPLLDYQADVVKQCLKVIADGERQLLIQMPTGAGKTRTAMELLARLAKEKSWFPNGQSIVWLAHTEELCEQAIESFVSVWTTNGSASTHVARLWGTYPVPPSAFSGGLIVAGTSRLHSLRSKDPAAFGALSAHCAIIVLDEAHRALAPTVQSQIKALRKNGALLVGLSATPARRDEPSLENKALAGLFGRNLILPDLGPDPIGELRERGILARVERIELNYNVADEDPDVPSDLGPDEDFPERLLASLETIHERNRAIVKEVQARATRKAPAIVFSCSVRHAELLSAALRLRGMRAIAVDCRMRRGARRQVIQQFASGQVDVLLNYGVLSTGFDAPNVGTVVIARPTNSVILYSQMLGRGLRGPKMGGTELCTLVDVRDHFSRFGELNDLYLRFKPYWS